MSKVMRALVSVSDKKGVLDLGKRLAKLGVEILSTGGTARALREAGVPVRDVSDFTGFPEMLDGRVKTLHPRVHGGILGRATDEHREQMREHGIDAIDLVVVNLYPFRETVARGASFEEVIENIDIGGPAMVRSAAKNHERVAIVVDPADYDRVLGELETHGRDSAAACASSFVARPSRTPRPTTAPSPAIWPPCRRRSGRDRLSCPQGPVVAAPTLGHGLPHSAGRLGRA